MHYLLKIGSTWYIRVVVPRDLEAQFPYKEFKRSLRTASKTEARRLMTPALAAIHGQFAEKRAQTMRPKRSITAEAVSLFRRLYPGTDTHVEATPVQRFGDWVVHQEPELVIHPDLETVQKLLDEGWRVNTSGDWEFVGVTPPAPVQVIEPIAASVASQEPAPERPALLLSEAKKLYIDHCNDPQDKTHFKANSPRTIASKMQAFIQLENWLGGENVSIESLLDRDFKPFTLFMMEKAGLSKVSANCRLKDTRNFFKHLYEVEKRIDRVPVIKDAKLQGKEKIKRANLPYSSDELTRFFNYLMTNKPHIRRERKTQVELIFLILMFIYTGFRREEQMSFTRDKVGRIKGIDVFDFTEMSKDNTASIRMVPLHSKLKALGFLKFADKQQESIFPRNDANYRKKFDTVLRALGIKEEAYQKTFHSCRATFDSMLAGEIEDSTRKMLMGHTLPGMDKLYVHQMHDKMPLYQKAVEKLKYDLPFDALKEYLRTEVNDLY